MKSEEEDSRWREHPTVEAGAFRGGQRLTVDVETVERLRGRGQSVRETSPASYTFVSVRGSQWNECSSWLAFVKLDVSFASSRLIYGHHLRPVAVGEILDTLEQIHRGAVDHVICTQTPAVLATDRQ